MSAILLDTHVVHWWSAEPHRLSKVAQAALSDAEELAISSISWFELAWLASHERILLTVPIGRWLEGLAVHVQTFEITPRIADTAVSLPSTFPGDPADRLIFATAIEHGMRLVTKDQRIRRHRHPRPVALW